MGSGYKTTAGKYVENTIYQAPYDAQAKVIEKIDSSMTDTEDRLNSLYSLLDVEGLGDEDKARIQAITSQYSTEIDQLGSDAAENVLDYGKYTSKSKSLARRIKDDVTRGELAKISGNKMKFDEFMKAETARIKATKGRVLASDIEAAKKYYLNNFEGTKYNKGEYNDFNANSLNGYISAMDLADKDGKGYVASAVRKMGAEIRNGHIYKSKGSLEEVRGDDILDGVMVALEGNVELKAYNDQRIKFGQATKAEIERELREAALHAAVKYERKDELKYSVYDITTDSLYVERMRMREAAKKRALEKRAGKLALLASPGYQFAVKDAEQKEIIARPYVTALSQMSKVFGKNVPKVFSKYLLSGDVDNASISAMQGLAALETAARTAGNKEAANAYHAQLLETNKNYIDYNHGTATASWINTADAFHKMSQFEGSTAPVVTKDEAVAIVNNLRKNFEELEKNPETLYGLPSKIIEINKEGEQWYAGETDPKSSHHITTGTLNQWFNEGRVGKGSIVPGSLIPSIITLDEKEYDKNMVTAKILVETDESYRKRLKLQSKAAMGDDDSNEPGIEDYKPETVVKNVTFSLKDLNINFFKNQ